MKQNLIQKEITKDMTQVLNQTHKQNYFKMKERIKEYLLARGLEKPDRHREKNYQRIILAAFLRKENVSFQVIGKMMQRNHATIINMIKNYEFLSNYSDFRQLEEQIKAELECYSLEERILKVDNMADLYWLQEEIKKSLSL